MASDSKLMDMLTGYAAAHQHPVNIAVHLVGIPTIMLGVLIPLSWPSIDIDGFSFSFADLVVVCFFLFYLTLDRVFAAVFLVFGLVLAWLAGLTDPLPRATGWTIAAVLFFGGYLAQFIGHAIEKSMPVLVKHPIQANLAAPFFTVVELFKLLGLRESLFNQVQNRIAELRERQSDPGESHPT